MAHFATDDHDIDELRMLDEEAKTLVEKRNARLNETE